jgi:glycosyltransferase involved in cell wall biosynthesis
MTDTRHKPSVDVVVAGYRDLYGTPQAIDHAGLLRYLVTDFYVGKGSPLHALRPLLRHGPGLARKLLARDSRLPGNKIIANNLSGLRSWWRSRKARTIEASATIHRQLADDLAATYRRRCRPPADVVVGYRMSDRLFLCQNDGGSHEMKVVREAHGRALEWHPSAEGRTLEPLSPTPGDWFFAESARLQEEWALATKIVCWSDWCQHCVVAEGVPLEKCVVLPPTFTPSPAYEAVQPDFDTDPFTVLFLGTLCIRKGTHDLIMAVAEAAKERPLRLVLAGANGLNPEMLQRYGHCIDYRGFVTRDTLPDFFSAGHVLALPSYSEGLPMVQLEAMAAGLPVIRTSSAGNAARDGQEGLVVPAGNPDAIKSAILRLAENRGELREMGANARRRVADFSVEACTRRWREVVADLTS